MNACGGAFVVPAGLTDKAAISGPMAADPGSKSLRPASARPYVSVSGPPTPTRGLDTQETSHEMASMNGSYRR